MFTRSFSETLFASGRPPSSRNGFGLPGQLKLGDEERGHVPVGTAGQRGQHGLGEEPALGLDPCPGHVDGQAVDGEPGLGVVRSGRLDEGASPGQALRTERQELGAEGVGRGGGVAREAIDDR